MKFALVFMILVTLSIASSLILSQYEKEHGELDMRIKPFFLLTLGLLFGYILRLLFLS